jgi:hypothetical protein
MACSCSGTFEQVPVYVVSLTANCEHAAELVMGGDNIYGATPDHFSTYLEYDSGETSLTSVDSWTVNYVGYVGNKLWQLRWQREQQR